MAEKKTKTEPLLHHGGADIQAMAKELELQIPLASPYAANDLNKLFPLLRATVREDAIDRTKGTQTGKGYNTTGYGYQALVDRLNEVVGIGHWETIIAEEAYEEGRYGNNRVRHTYELTIRLELGYPVFIPGEDGVPQRKWVCVVGKEMKGTHESPIRGDAFKGAYTNGLKKCVGFFGPGADAYLGILDEDLRPLPEGFEGEMVGSRPEDRGQRQTRGNQGQQRPPQQRPPQQTKAPQTEAPPVKPPAPAPPSAEELEAKALVEGREALKALAGEMFKEGWKRDAFIAMAKHFIQKENPETGAEYRTLIDRMRAVRTGDYPWPPPPEDLSTEKPEPVQEGLGFETDDPTKPEPK